VNYRQKWLLVGIGAGVALASLVQLGLIICKVDVGFGIILTSFIIGGMTFSLILSKKEVKNKRTIKKGIK